MFKRISSLKEEETLLYQYLLSLIFLFTIKYVSPDYNINSHQCRYYIKHYQLAGLIKFRKFYFAKMKPLGNFLQTKK